MNGKKKQFRAMLLLISLLLGGLIVLNGCKKSEPAAPAGVEEVTSAAVEQTTCPVMAGGAINKDIFTEYKGKKVYFCCPGCVAKFKADPEKYLPKLPQFKK